jgi:hypothetical protein
MMLWSYAFCLVSPWSHVATLGQSCTTEEVVLLGDLNGGNTSMSLTMNNTFHLLSIYCPFFWASCYMYPKKVCAS